MMLDVLGHRVHQGKKVRKILGFDEAKIFSLNKDTDSFYLSHIGHPEWQVVTSKPMKDTIKKTTIKDLINKISKLYKKEKKLKISFSKPTPGDLLGCYANIEKVKKHLGFKPSIRLNKGLHLFKDWAEKNFYSLNWKTRIYYPPLWKILRILFLLLWIESYLN